MRHKKQEKCITENMLIMADRKWCASCQVERPSDGFKLVRTGTVNRWRCGVCLARQAQPKYKGKNNAK
jgi:hypothetical protein